MKDGSSDQTFTVLQKDLMDFFHSRMKKRFSDFGHIFIFIFIFFPVGCQVFIFPHLTDFYKIFCLLFFSRFLCILHTVGGEVGGWGGGGRSLCSDHFVLKCCF